MDQAMLELLELTHSEPGTWIVRSPGTGEEMTITGRKAALLSVILATANYQLREDFHPLDAFSEDSLKRGQPVN